MNSDDSTNTVLTLFHSLLFQTLTPRMNSRTPSPALPLFRMSTFFATHSDSNSPAPSSYTDATTIFSPKVSDQPDPSRPVTEELEHELDKFITLQQQLQNNNTHTILNLAHSVSSCESSNPASTVEETRARRVFKRKHPNARTFHRPEHPDCFPFTPSTLTRKNFSDIINHVSHKTHIVAPTKTK